jgi:superfamily II DNA helicase RecQ
MTHQVVQDTTIDTYGLVGLVINSDTLREAVVLDDTGKRRDLWEEARTDKRISMLIISREQLVLDGFETLASSKEFTSCCCCLGVNECHLLLTWGAQFRKPFQQIGLVRACLRDGLPLMALTATMCQGAPETEVRSFLGLRTGSYHYIRQSNLRFLLSVGLEGVLLSPAHVMGGFSMHGLRRKLGV